MKQVVQFLRSGRLEVKDLPPPTARAGHVVIGNATSLISPGTEKMLREMARKSLVGKAMQRPDELRRVLVKLRNEGLESTVSQVMGKLDEPIPLGYSSAGTVLAVGAGVQAFKPGDRVASNGGHAHVVSVPRMLCGRVPDSVGFDQAAFAVLGAIALQGIRLGRLELGETAYVVGLGLVGQLTVALLRASGVRVLGVDPDAARCELARRMGADAARPDLSARDVLEATGGLGADAVVLTASTASNKPIEQAAEAVRRKGRIVLVGVVGLELDRRPFFFKECEFVVSCSYGAGRYDPVYEERGHDYPAAYVRWTEQRNIQAVLDLMGTGRLDVTPLISHRFTIEEAERAYRIIETDEEPSLGLLLQYGPPEPVAATVRKSAPVASKQAVGFAALGAGNFGRAVLLPAACGTSGLTPVVLCSAGGLSATHAAEKLGFSRVTTEERSVFTDPEVGAVIIATRHDHHAHQVVAAIRAGKHVFVEKPLCLTVEELAEIEQELAARPDALLMVGFNRRFSPAAAAVRQFFANVDAPLTVSIRFNAGAIPADHWTQDDAIGGGRIVGEACHAIDLATYLVGSPPTRVFAESVGGSREQVTDDQCFITLRHANGSVSSVAYLAGGDKAFPKERVEVAGGGRIAVIDDFKDVELWSRGAMKRKKLWRQDKGHRQELAAFAGALQGGGEWPISWDDMRQVSLAAIMAVRSLREGMPVNL